MTDLELQPDLAPAPTTLTPAALPSASDLEQTWHLASRIAKTEFVPANLRNKPEAVLAVFLTGRELGIGPMQSLRDIYPVNGRPAMMATLMVSRVRGLGHRFKTLSSTDTEATVQIHRRGEREPEPAVTFTIEDARRAKLDGKETYRLYPKAMLWSRAASAACRRDASEALGAAVYTPEELDELPPPTTTVQAGPAEIDGEPFEHGMPKRWAIDNIRHPDDARWLLQQPEVGDDYREAVKAAVAELYDVPWRSFWWNAKPDEWRGVLDAAIVKQSGSARPSSPGAPADPDPKSPPTPTQAPEVPSEADRVWVEGGDANHDRPAGGDGPPTDTAAQGSADGSATSPGQPAAGSHRSRPANASGEARAGRATSEGDR